MKLQKPQFLLVDTYLYGFRPQLNRIAIVIGLLGTPLSSLQAGMQQNLEKAFNSLGMSGNFTTAGGYQDQTGGFYTGGSLISRGKVNTVDLFSLQVPSYKAGCGGIDMHFGGLSFIAKEQFLPMLRQIGQNAAGYAFQLGLATQTPQLKAIIDELAKAAQDAANMSISSCEAAATVIGGVWPQSDASSQLLCNAMSKDLGLASDWVESRQKCSQQRTQINSRKKEKEEYQSFLGEEFNLAWKAIQKNNFLKQDTDLAEFFMTLSGTLISKLNGQKKEMRYIPAASSDPELIKGIIVGGIQMSILKCDNKEEDKCLNPQKQKNGGTAIAQQSSLLARTQKILDAISTKIKSDSPLSQEEKSFVESTSIPILKIMLIESAYKKGQGSIHINNYSEAIAYDILLQYIDEILALIENSLVQLKQGQMDQDTIDRFRSGLMDSRHLIQQERSNLFQQIMITLETIEKTLQLESKLQNAFLSHQFGSRLR